MTTSNVSETSSIPLLPCYVYVLIDPRNQAVFYVGKGQDTRAQQHVAEAKAKIARGQELDSPKLEKIQEILADGFDPIELVVARFETKPEALAVESTLIKWMYGFSALTNLVHGHGADNIRSCGDISVSPGLDIPEPVRSNDGTFRDENIQALEDSGAFDFLSDLTNCLCRNNFTVRNFSESSDRPFDPGKSNGWLGLIVRIHAIDFILIFSKTRKVSLYVANTQFSRTDLAQRQLNNIEQNLGKEFACGAPINSKVQGQGRYRPIGLAPNFESFSRPKFAPGDLTSPLELLQKLALIEPKT